MRAAVAVALAFVAPATGCYEPPDFFEECYRREDPSETFQQAAMKAAVDGCAVALTVAPCDSELKSLLMGPPGSQCDIASRLPPDTLPPGLTIGDVIDQVTSQCKMLPQGASVVQSKLLLAQSAVLHEAVRQSALVHQITDPSTASFLRVIGATRDEEGEMECSRRSHALQQCLQPYGQQLMQTSLKFAQDVCGIAKTTKPCFRYAATHDDVLCGWNDEDTQIARAVFHKIGEACAQVPPSMVSFKAAVTERLTPSGPISVTALTILGCVAAVFALGYHQWNSRSEETVKEEGMGLTATEESYGAV